MMGLVSKQTMDAVEVALRAAGAEMTLAELEAKAACGKRSTVRSAVYQLAEEGRAVVGGSHNVRTFRAANAEESAA